MKITIDDVLKFIEEEGMQYDYDIQLALDKLKKGKPIEEIINKRKSMYERLAKL